MKVEKGTSRYTQYLNDDEKRKFDRQSTPGLFEGTRGGHSFAAISESGLNKLIMRSDKPEAKPFQEWVTRDVLPAIRKDGGYIMGEEKVPP